MTSEDTWWVIGFCIYLKYRNDFFFFFYNGENVRIVLVRSIIEADITAELMLFSQSGHFFLNHFQSEKPKLEHKTVFLILDQRFWRAAFNC